MKKFLLALLVLSAGFGVRAEGDWRTTLGKVQDFCKDFGFMGFAKKEAPAYITGNFVEADRPAKPDFTQALKPAAEYANRNGFWVVNEDQAKAYSTEKHAFKVGDWVGGYFDDKGAFVPGHEVKTLFDMPYGIGQLIMIPICLVLMYLAIVKGFEPLLLLPIGFGGLLANCPMAGVTAPAMMHDGVITFMSSGVAAMSGGIVEPGGFLHYFFSFGIDTGIFPTSVR